MITTSMVRTITTLSLLLAAMATPAAAQATRTWVSGVGDDANPCSRTAPCKTFAGAISKTATAGEIDALDPGGFGALTITKSIAIEGDGTLAGVLAAGTNGIIVNAPAGSNVSLRNLIINGAATGLNGIRFLAGGTLSIENCLIDGFTQKGIDVAPGASVKVFIKDSIIRNAAGGGIQIDPTGGTTIAAIDHVRVENSLFGIRVDDNTKATITNSVTSNNTNNGFVANSAAGLAEMNIDNSTSSNNGSAALSGGLRASGPQAIIRIGRTTVTDNHDALSVAGGGQILSYGNNTFAGNVVDASPTGAVPGNPR
jgi:hypothetical protein